MRLIASALASLLIAHLAASAGPAFACGQITVSHSAAVPGAKIEVRGYGFWSDPRPVGLAWESGRAIAMVELDSNGTFSISITVPEAEGAYRVVATQGEDNSAPVYASIQVTRSVLISQAQRAWNLRPREERSS